MKKIKKLVVVVLMVYVTIVLINQQKTLISYKSTQKDIAKKIEEAEEYTEKLEYDKEHINSNEYIEKVAREKLNMYYPNERIYIDNGQ